MASLVFTADSAGDTDDDDDKPVSIAAVDAPQPQQPQQSPQPAWPAPPSQPTQPTQTPSPCASQWRTTSIYKEAMSRALADPTSTMGVSTQTPSREPTILYNDDVNPGFYAFAHARDAPVERGSITSTMGGTIQFVKGQRVYGQNGAPPPAMASQWHIAWIQRGCRDAADGVEQCKVYTHQHRTNSKSKYNPMLYTGTDNKGREFVDGVEQFEVRVFRACYQSFDMPMARLGWTCSFALSAHRLHESLALHMDYYTMAPTFSKPRRNGDVLTEEQRQAFVAAIAADFVCGNWYLRRYDRRCETFGNDCFVFFALLREAGHRFCVVDRTVMMIFTDHVQSWHHSKLERPCFFKTAKRQPGVPGLTFKSVDIPPRPQQRPGHETQCVCFWHNEEYLIANEQGESCTDEKRPRCGYCKAVDDAVFHDPEQPRPLCIPVGAPPEMAYSSYDDIFPRHTSAIEKFCRNFNVDGAEGRYVGNSKTTGCTNPACQQRSLTSLSDHIPAAHARRFVFDFYNEKTERELDLCRQARQAFSDIDEVERAINAGGDVHSTWAEYEQNSARLRRESAWQEWCGSRVMNDEAASAQTDASRAHAAFHRLAREAMEANERKCDGAEQLLKSAELMGVQAQLLEHEATCLQTHATQRKQASDKMHADRLLPPTVDVTKMNLEQLKRKRDELDLVFTATTHELMPELKRKRTWRLVHS